MPTLNEKNTQQQGLVVSYFGNRIAVETDEGQVFQCHLKRNQALPVVGDRVIWEREGDDSGTIKAILPRRSCLYREGTKKEQKVIAANIDYLVIVMGPPPIFSEYLLDHYLIAAELLNIAPLIVLNKIDLLNNDQKAEIEVRLEPYKEVPYPIMLTSIYYQETLNHLASCLKNKTSVLMGPSGVGKSSLISLLSIVRESLRIQAVSTKGAGKHTTTATCLYHLHGGGHLIDSPGVREFNLWRVTEEEVLKGFKEFEQFASDCKFRDCKHLSEPHCAVQEAVSRHQISQKRHAHYQMLMKEAHTSHDRKS